MACFDEFWAVFCPCPRQKNVQLVDAEDGNIIIVYTLSELWGWLSFLLHCNASNLVLEI